jgi:hypothetical protein
MTSALCFDTPELFSQLCYIFTQDCPPQKQTNQVSGGLSKALYMMLH